MLLKVKQVSTFREVQKISESVLRFYFSLGCFPLWPIAEQRGEINPVPATTNPFRNERVFLCSVLKYTRGLSVYYLSVVTSFLF